MKPEIRDPVSRVSYRFEPRGESLVVHVRIEPGGSLRVHSHLRQEERWSVVEGTVRLRLGKSTLVIGPENGEIVVPPGVSHGFSSVGSRAVRLRCVATPALRLRELLEESAAAGNGGLVGRGWIPRGPRGARWIASFLERYRTETVFASPPPIVQRLLIAVLARRAGSVATDDLPFVQDAAAGRRR